MDLKEKILKDFEKICFTANINNHNIFLFLRDLYKYIYEGIFIIGEKDDFEVEIVEGETYFDVQNRVLKVGSINIDTKIQYFEALVTIMQYYQFLMEKPEDKSTFKYNTERALAIDYLTTALSNYFLGDYCWPDVELAEIMKNHGLIEEILLLRMFAQKYIRQVEYNGDLERLFEKIKEAIHIFNEIQDGTDEDEEMTKLIAEQEPEGAQAIDPEKEKENFLKNLLEGITLD
ncbi:MAG: hypothetical protein ACFFCS_27265 [Candidatus Hodarchaeota archaeon]